MKESVKKQKTGMTKEKRNDILFFIALAAIPLFMYFIGNFYINGSALVLAFQTYGENRRLVFNGLNNFIAVLRDLSNESWMKETLLRSFLIYLMLLVFTTVVPLITSFFLFKRFPMHGFFKVVFFIPNIISSVVTATSIKFMADRVIPGVALDWFNKDLGLGLLSENDTRFGTMMFIRLWFSIGAGMLLNVGVMNTTDKNVVEAGVIDGCGLFREFWHIVLPHCYKTLALGFVFGFGLIFTEDLGLYSYYGEAAPQNLWTIGYVFLVNTKNASEYLYPYYSAWGMLESLIIIPLTFIARYAVMRFGPSEE